MVCDDGKHHLRTNRALNNSLMLLLLRVTENYILSNFSVEKCCLVLKGQQKLKAQGGVGGVNTLQRKMNLILHYCSCDHSIFTFSYCDLHFASYMKGLKDLNKRTFMKSHQRAFFLIIAV